MGLGAADSKLLNKGVQAPTIQFAWLANGSGWNIGLNAYGASTAFAYDPAVLNANQTYLVVGEYNFSSFTASLFLDPTPGGVQPSMPDATKTGTSAPGGIQNVQLASEPVVDGNFILDNLIVGQTWSDVTPTATPEPSTLALSALGLLGLVVQYRRRRK